MPTYPLYDNEGTNLNAANGHPLSDVTVDAALHGLALDDIQIDKTTLQAQAQIARASGYAQLALNLERAAELTAVPRTEIIAMYQLMRPGRASYDELQALAERLAHEYAAPICAALVREAADVYRQRNMLKRPPAF
ncbi:MAG: diol dehydratase small subunit [Roseiflexaceae bacterium]